MDTNTLHDYQYLKDLVASLSLAQDKDRRVQLKMPKRLVDLLDAHFPHIDRSTLLTQAVANLLLQQQRIAHPELESWVNQEQYNLDRMETYLNERETDV